MNEELLRECPHEVQLEHWRQRDLLGVMERSLQVAVQAIRSGKPPEDLPGRAPAVDAPEHEWVEYLVGQGALVFHDELA